MRLKCRHARFKQKCSVRPRGAIDFLVPNYRIVAHRRTDRIGGDRMLKDENGESIISMEDYSLALVDEIARF
jgi:putative NADH-flavin reductase